MNALSDDRQGGDVPSKQAFAALRNLGFRRYFIYTAAAMMADSIEHVISYWVVFQKFQSPALGGYAILSHWLPMLLFGVLSGALTDRYDARRLIQIGMLLFMSCSLMWGVLFLTDTLQIWHSAAILTVHGIASVLWGPASQVLLHDMVDVQQLPSAVRLNATARQLGLLAGPALGGVVMLLLGTVYGILVNALFYVPLVLFLWKAPYGRFRNGGGSTQPIRPLMDIITTISSIRDNRLLVSMILLSGATAILVSNAYQAQLPNFAQDLGYGEAGLFYTMLLAADAAGAITGGIILEATGWLRPRPGTTFILVLIWCGLLVCFALTPMYTLALLFLFAAGFFELCYNSMAQSLIQLNAPPGIRGRVLGLYSVAALGLRAFSGVTVGLGGSIIGIHRSLAISAVCLALITVTLWLLIRPSFSEAT